MVECCFCDEPFEGMVSVVLHLLTSECGKRCPSWHVLNRYGGGEQYIQCWCGERFEAEAHWLNRTRFAYHLEQRGGLATHILEVALGCTEG